MNYSHKILRSAAAAVLAVGTLLGAPHARAQTDFQGMSLFGYGNLLGNPDLRESLYDMRALGVDTVALNVWWRQDTKTSNVIYEDVGGMSASMAQINAAIDAIHDLGMRVFLKPNVDSADGVWRALLQPTNPSAWFASYGSYINTMADLAQQKGVALFSVGTEMESLANNPAYTGQWTNIINNVRSRYSGPVTYAGNHGDAFDGPVNYGNYEDVPFWNQLDYIGVDAYFPLTGTNNPTPAQLQAAWTTRANSIQAWRQARGLTIPVFFPEVGYAAFDGTNRTPWGDNQTGVPDPLEQRDCYEALLAVMTARPWFEGAFWWSWETAPHAGLAQPMGFTPQDRPAQQVLANYYGGIVPPPAPRPPELIGRWEQSLDGYNGANGATIAPSALGVTEGAGSLAVTSPSGGFRWSLQKMFDGASGNAHRTWIDAAANPADYRLEFDVTYSTAAIPQSQVTFIVLHAAVNSPAGWSQVDNLAVTNGRTNQTLHVAVPMSQFTLAPNSTWYQFNIALNGNWGASPATIYLDNLRIVDLNAPAPGDFNGDGAIDAADLAWWRYGMGYTTHGDADRDGDTDGADLLAWQRSLTAPAAPIPEPATALAALIGCQTLVRVGMRRRGLSPFA